VILELMSEFQQVPAAALQLPRQLSGGYALGETPEDEDQHRGPVVGPLEHGSSPGVEDSPTCRAAIVKDGFPVVAMDDESLVSVAAGTLQPLGMDESQEELIAGVLIHKGVDREVHGSVSSNIEGLALEIEPGTLLEIKSKSAPF
jgi:hypothetical protein